MDGRSITADIVKGAVAGAVATWLMGRVTTWIYARQAERTREAEKAGWVEGNPAFVEAAHRGAGAIGVALDERQAQRAGTMLHWALGMSAGALYAVERRTRSHAGLAHGVGFGLTVFVLVDELANWLLGFSKAPTAFPWQAHARGLAGHVAYGAVTEAALGALRRVG